MSQRFHAPAVHRDLVDQSVAMANALMALRLKRGGRLKSTREGIEIHQPGKPFLLLTHAAAEEFARQIEEAEDQ
jgi:hypothetical protein